MMIHLVRELNRAFSAGGLFLSYKSWGAAPGSHENAPLALRFAPSDFLAESTPGLFGTLMLNILREFFKKLSKNTLTRFWAFR
jgi:hypothetical protein